MNPRAGHDPLPATCPVAFKEWSSVCQALDDGRQVLLLRKGGITEEGGRFQPDETDFWLYPTQVHQAEQAPGSLRPEAAEPVADDLEFVALRNLAHVRQVHYLEDELLLPALAGWQTLPADVLRRRFHYRRPGIWVLAVRIYRRGEPWRIQRTPAHAGCKTWVPLNENLATAGVEPVLTDAEFDDRVSRLAAVLQAAAAGSNGPDRSDS